VRFQPSQHSEYGASTTLATTALSTEATLAALMSTGTVSGGAAAAGAAAASGGGGGHLSDKGFLGLNWRSIGASVVVGTCVAITTDIVLSFLKPRLFQRAPSTEKK
jgi:hypothetical protein